MFTHAASGLSVMWSYWPPRVTGRDGAWPDCPAPAPGSTNQCSVQFSSVYWWIIIDGL